MQRLDWNDWLALAIIAAAAVATGVLYAQLPPRMPVHWNSHGVADSFVSRAFGATGLLGAALVVWPLLRFGYRLLPLPLAAKLEGERVSIVAFLFTAIVIVFHATALYASLAPRFTVSGGITMLFGGFWIALGVLLPKAPPNPKFGIRTPWTLASAENWKQTHLVGGIAFVVGGLTCITCGVLLHRGALQVMLATIFFSAVIPVFYSFFRARLVSR